MTHRWPEQNDLVFSSCPTVHLDTKFRSNQSEPCPPAPRRLPSETARSPFQHLPLPLTLWRGSRPPIVRGIKRCSECCSSRHIVISKTWFLMNERAERRAGIYARVSTEEQVDGTSLATQLRSAVRAFVVDKGWNIADEYVDEGVSGSLSSRPALNRLLAAVRARQIQVVVVAKLDRFGRCVRHLSSLLGELDDLNVEFVSLSESIDRSTPGGFSERFLRALLKLSAIGSGSAQPKGLWPSLTTGIGRAVNHPSVSGQSLTASVGAL